MPENEQQDFLDENGENLPVACPPDFLKPKKITDKPHSWKKWVFYAILLVVTIFLINYGLKFYALAKWSQKHVSIDPVTLQPKKTGLLETIRSFFGGSSNFNNGQDQSRINILLLGIGGPGHDGPYLTDTNIIVSIDPATKKAALISIPRDLSVKIDDYGYRKINNASAFGEVKAPGAGGEYARQIFAQTFGIDIPYYVRVDFQAFVDLVDAVGGVDINVERTFTDYTYPAENFAYQTVSFEAGTQHMDGERALIFARSRHGNNGEGSDFARAKRQQMVISTLKEKFLSAGTYLNPMTAQKIVDSLTTHIATNMTFGQIMSLADLAKNIDHKEIKTLVLDSSPTGFLKNFISQDGAFMLAPKTGNFNEINSAIANVFESTSTPKFGDTSTPTTNTVAKSTPTASTTKVTHLPAAKIEIQNGTWKIGFAARFKQELIEKGFNITTIGNCLKRPIATTTVYVLNPQVNKDVLLSLVTEMNVVPTTTLPTWLATPPVGSRTSTYAQDTEILIILGEQN